MNYKMNPAVRSSSKMERALVPDRIAPLIPKQGGRGYSTVLGTVCSRPVYELGKGAWEGKYYSGYLSDVMFFDVF